MISDILSVTQYEITRYRKEYPKSYASMAVTLDALQAHIEIVYRYLDTPPIDPVAMAASYSVGDALAAAFPPMVDASKAH